MQAMTRIFRSAFMVLPVAGNPDTPIHLRHIGGVGWTFGESRLLHLLPQAEALQLDGEKQREQPKLQRLSGLTGRYLRRSSLSLSREVELRSPTSGVRDLRIGEPVAGVDLPISAGLPRAVSAEDRRSATGRSWGTAIRKAANGIHRHVDFGIAPRS